MPSVLEALEHAERCLRGTRRLGSVHGLRGCLLLDRGRAVEARDLLRSAVLLLGEAAMPRDVAMARGNLAYTLILTGEYTEAGAVMAEALADARRLGITLLEAYLVGNSGLLDHLEGRLTEALTSYREAIARFVAAGVSPHAARTAGDPGVRRRPSTSSPEVPRGRDTALGPGDPSSRRPG